MGVVFKPTKVSVVIAILNSHRIVKRQLRNFRNMKLPDDVEIIFMDDGSNPPLKQSIGDGGVKNLYIYPTGDFRPWTQGLARNLGAKIAQGEYLFFTDIDHVLTRDAIMAVREFAGDKMVFPRHFGILDARGNITQDLNVLFKFGFNRSRYRRRRLEGGFHTNTFAMKKSLFVQLDGFNPKFCESCFHVGGKFMSEERDFFLKYHRYVKRGLAQKEEFGPKIYVYPTGKFQENGEENPFDLFHGTSREQVPQPMLESPDNAIPETPAS